MNKNFIQITNIDIYNKLENIEELCSKLNGKVRLNRWIATTALTIVLSLSFVIISLNFMGG